MLIFLIFFVPFFFSLNAYIDLGDDISFLCNSSSPVSKTCYCSEIIPYLPNLADLTEPIPENSIFFFDTTCKEGLDIRQLCSVEAAARANPDREVNVLFAGPIQTYTSATWQLLRIININLYRVHLPKFVRQTPLEELLPGRDKCPVERLTDVLKYLTLYKFGGIYLDFGVIITKSFDSWSQQDNWIVKADDTQNINIIALSRDGLGHTISNLALRRFLYNFKYKDWTDRNNDVLIEVLIHVCGTALSMLMTPDRCRGFHFYNKSYVFMIPYEHRQLWFDKSVALIPPDPMAFYVSDFSVYNYTKIDENSRFMQLMKDHCPETRSLASKT